MERGAGTVTGELFGSTGAGWPPWWGPPRTRRSLLGAGCAAAAASTLGGCGWFSTDPDSGSKARGNGRDGRQPPALGKQVKAGKLPALADRLPERPLVIEPVQRSGEYGGTWRSAVLGHSGSYLYAIAGYENLLTWTPAWTGAAGTSELTPNVAESYEASDDATRFTFRLRKGLKWSRR